MVRIVNWILTRRCNLRCDYCGIVKVRGEERISHYKKNEIPAERVITLLNKFKTYNPDIFHIFYGGEPFLRGDLSDILKFCNENDIYYTIISNCTPDIQPKILRVMDEVGGFRGFTGSVDPVMLQEPTDSHTQLKSSAAFGFLMQMKNYVDDVVAEVTMTKDTLDKTYDLIKMLSSGGIYTSLTALDINKNYLYDFSAYSATCRLIKESRKSKELYWNIMADETLLIHMKDEVLPMLFRYISSDYNCENEKTIHNLTIDSDGKVRTCLRIRGNMMPNHINDKNLFLINVNSEYYLNPFIFHCMEYDRYYWCQGCNHTCVMMSNYIEYREGSSNKILDH